MATKRLTGKNVRTRRLAIPFRERGHGRHAYRLVKPGDSRHVNGVSRTLYVRTR